MPDVPTIQSQVDAAKWQRCRREKADLAAACAHFAKPEKAPEPVIAADAPTPAAMAAVEPPKAKGKKPKP